MKTTLKTLLTGLAICAFGVAGAPRAEAAAILISDGINTPVVIYDNGVGDMDPALGQISHIGGIGAFVDIEVALTKPSVGSPTSPVMDLSFLAGSFSPTTNTLLIGFSDTDFGPTSPFALAAATGTTTGTVTYATLQDPGNSLFGGATITSNTAGPGVIAISTPGTIAGDTSFPYSLTQFWTITHPGSLTFQLTQVDFSTLIVAPGSPVSVPDGGWAVGLLGFALMGVEGLRRKFTRV